MAFTKTKKTEQFWDVEIPVGVAEINEKKKIVVKRVTKGENQYVDVRQEYMKADGTWGIGKGIAIPASEANDIAEMIKVASQLDENDLPF